MINVLKETLVFWSSTTYDGAAHLALELKLFLFRRFAHPASKSCCVEHVNHGRFSLLVLLSFLFSSMICGSVQVLFTKMATQPLEISVQTALGNAGNTNLGTIANKNINFYLELNARIIQVFFSLL